MYSKELIKGTIKPIILKMLSEKDSMYGYEIVQAVKALSQGKIHIKEGSLYPILHALKKEGVLETESREVGGRTRKYYSISQKGTPQVEASLNEFSDFVQTLQLILNPKVA